MKRHSKMIILLCVLAVCIGGYLIISGISGKETTAANEKNETVALCKYTAEEIAALSWSANEGNLRFTKDDSGWHYDADAAVPVDESTLDSLTEKLCSLSANRMIENVTDSSIYGFSEPAFTLTAEWKDGSSSTYTMGDATAFADGYYVMLSGDSNVYTVASSLSGTFNKTLNSLIVMEEIPAVENVTELAAADVEAHYLENAKTINTDMHWVDDEENILNTSAVEELISNIQSLSWEELVTASATEEVLKSYGFDDAAKVFSVENAEGDSTKLLIGSANEDGNYYVKLPDSKMVYTMAQSDVETILQTTRESLKAKNVLLTLPYEDVASAVFSFGAAEYSLQIATQSAASESAEGDEQNAAEEEAADPAEDDRALWEQLTAIVSLGEAEEKDGDIVLKVKVTNQGGITAELVIREYDAENYAAQLDDESGVLVSAEKVDKIIRTLKQMKE